MKEIWKDVIGYEGLYKVSNCGKVKSLHYEGTDRIQELKPSDNGRGYMHIQLSKNGKVSTVYIHRLVAEAFIENPLNLPEVNHIDENTSHNEVSNLEWCDKEYNCNYGNHNKNISKSKGYPVLCLETGITYAGTNDAYRKTGISFQNISLVCKGKRQTAGGYHWKYI